MSHVLKPLYICHRIMAPMRLSTNTNLPFLKFDLTNCFWEKNYFSATTHARGSVEVSKWPEDHPLRHLFQPGGWKSTLSSSFIMFFERVTLFWLLPRGIFGTFKFQSCIWVFKMWGKRNFSKGSQFGHFPRNFVSLLFRIFFFWSKRFQILPLDGGPQHLIHVNLVCFNLDKGFRSL